MKQIGGYFELETFRGMVPWHKTPALASGRACIRFLLETVKPRQVFLPYYCCETVTAPFERLGTSIVRYRLNKEFEIIEDFDLPDDASLLYINYFGLKTGYVNSLASRYESSLWVDNTQAFFSRLPDRIIGFNSARKFFGVADGAYLFGPPGLLDRASSLPVAGEPSQKHLLTRLFRGAEAGFAEFRAFESQINDDPRIVSMTSLAVLNQLDYGRIRKIRRNNFEFLCNRLFPSSLGATLVKDLTKEDVPFSFPYICPEPFNHQRLWKAGIFAPVLWPECQVVQGYGCEITDRFRHIVSIPIDHRYDFADMDRIVSVVKDARQ